MQIKTIAMMAIAGCAIGLSTGCVKQEDFDNMVKQKDAEKAQAVAELNNKLAMQKSEYDAAKEKARGLQNQLAEASARLSENKDKTEKLQTQLDDANDKISGLESSLKAAQEQVTNWKSRTQTAESEAATSKANAQEAQRRFDRLRLELIRLNKYKPAQLGIDLGDVEDSTSSTNGMSATDTSSGGTQQKKSNDSGSASPQSILDNMSNM